MAQETKYATHNEDETLSVEELDHLILTKYPRPIALGYEHLLCSQSDVERAITAVKVYETGLRAVALGLIVEYLGYPKELVNDEGFNRSLYWLLKKPSLGQWLQIVRGCLQAFRGKRDLLFVEELYDLEWVSTSRGPKKRRGVWGAFDMLGHLRNEALGHSIATLDPWERIADDCLDQLRSVLARFAFLRNYTLMRIVSIEENQVTGIVFSGTEVSSQTLNRSEISIRGDSEMLHRDWFYLCHAHDLLELHPLLIFLAEHPTFSDIRSVEGIYSAYEADKERIRYDTIYDTYPIKLDERDLVEAFKHLYDVELAEVRGATSTVGQRRSLTWNHLLQAVDELSEQQMVGAIRKYNPYVYLERAEIIQAFEDFFNNSPTTAMVLTGKSGVGKSNFVIWLKEKYEDNNNVCVWWLDGNPLEITQPLMTTLAQHLSLYFNHTQTTKEWDILADINQRCHMDEGHKLLLVIDAANENNDPNRLLEVIEHFVRKASAYPWLKLLITSRPQAWRNMRRALGNNFTADLYYRPIQTESIEVEIGEFGTVKMHDFERDELREVYEKYQREYDIATAYDGIPDETRRIIVDPLALSLMAKIASTHPQKRFPTHLAAHKLIETYVNDLIEQGIALKEGDEEFLERELMPYMLKPNDPGNRIRATEIQGKPTIDRRWQLAPLVEEDRLLLPSGKEIETEFCRLSDAGILLREGSRSEYEIRFPYERFYDLYAGRRLRDVVQGTWHVIQSSEVVQSPDGHLHLGATLKAIADKYHIDIDLIKVNNLQLTESNRHIRDLLQPGNELFVPVASGISEAEQADRYREYIGLIKDRAYLWGPVETALILELEAGNSSIFIELAKTIDHQRAELLVSALTTHGKTNLDAVREICVDLLEIEVSSQEIEGQLEMKPGREEQASTLAGQSMLEAVSTARAHMAKKVAIEVAYELGFEDIVEQAAYDKEAPVRAMAMRYIYYFWRDDQDKGFEIIDRISRQVSKGFIPDRRALESCLGISFMILFWHYSDLQNRSEYLARLQQIWRRPLKKLLFIGDEEGEQSRGVRSWVRNILINFGVNIAVRTLDRIEEEGYGGMFSVPEIKAFFDKSDAKQREVVRRLAPHVHAAHGGVESIRAIEEDLAWILEERDLLTNLVAFDVLIAHVLSERETTLEVVERLFNKGIHSPPPPTVEGFSPVTPLVPILIWIPRNSMYGSHFTGERLSKDDIDKETLDLMGHLIHQFVERHDGFCSTDLKQYRIVETYTYLSFYYTYTSFDTIKCELLDYLIDKMIEEEDTDGLVDLINNLSCVGAHPAFGMPHASVEGMQLLLHKLKGSELMSQLEEGLIVHLSNVRAYHPDVVDDFLAELDDDTLPPRIKRSVQARGASESLGQLLGTAGAWFARDIIIDPDPDARNFEEWFITEAAKHKSFNRWCSLVLKQMINMVYGRPVFRVPSWQDRP
jgi:hypothetical protein